MKIETIVEPNDHILKIQSRYVDLIGQSLPGRHIEMVGGVAVPMVGRPELDILVISDDIEADTQKLLAIGFDHRGIADNTSFLKLIVEGVDVTVQIMMKDNKMIEVHRKLIALLRRDAVPRSEYENFKRTLSGLERYEYKRRKLEYLKDNILPRI